MKKHILVICIFVLIMIFVIIGVVVRTSKLSKVDSISKTTGRIGNTDINKIWVGSFQIVWNELSNIMGKKIEFEDYTSELANKLNANKFTKEMLSEKDYYIHIGKTNEKLKEEILKDIENKFDMKEPKLLEKMDFSSSENSYTIYSMLIKEFEFLKKFEKLEAKSFNNSNEKFEYFGILNDRNLYDNGEVLFYNDETDFAIKLFTKENEEVILYNSKSANDFDKIYEEVIEKEEQYTGNKNFIENDYLSIPCIELETVINYDEICGKYIKGTNMYLKNAFQNVKFSLNEKGGSLRSETAITSATFSIVEKSRGFEFDDTFILFLKEKDKPRPYFALKIDDTSILKKIEKKYISEKQNEYIISIAKELLEDEECVEIIDKYFGVGTSNDYMRKINEELKEEYREEVFSKQFEDFLMMLVINLENIDSKNMLIDKIKLLDLTLLKNDDLKQVINEL